MAKLDEQGKKKGDQKTISVSISFQDLGDQKAPASRVYQIDGAGRLVNSKPVGKEALTFQVEAGQNYRFSLGPDLHQENRPRVIDLAKTLARAKALSQDFVAAIGKEKLVFKVPPSVYLCWYQVCVFVHGSVRKLLNPGGDVPQYAPICTGTVQIFEVDLACTLDNMASFTAGPFLIHLISKLKDLTLATVQPPILINPGDPSPDGRVIHQVSTQFSAPRAVSAPVARMAAAGSVKGAASLADAAATLATLDLASAKKYIVASKAILWPILCRLIPDEWFCWQELGEVAIQSDGTFSAEVCFWCPDDFPDLYFEVLQSVDGTVREISDPQIACSTYYNYDGSQSVDIVVDDPNAVACLPAGNPGPSYLYVWPTAIGNVDLIGIDGLEAPGSGTGLLAGPVPWGGTLSLQMQFHPDLPTTQVAYYRWSYKFFDESDFSPIHTTVTHRWKHVVYMPPSTIDITLIPVTLGPLPAATTTTGTPNLFAIPDPTLPWVDIVDPADRPFAYFDSTEGTLPRKSGRCRLKLEMFASDGHHVPCDNVGGGPTFKFILPKLGGAPGEYSNAPAANITAQGDLIFDIFVDNNPTDAELTGVSALGSADACGFLTYDSSSNVAIAYVAYHPNNYLDWKLSVSRGLTGVVVQDPPPPPGGSPGYAPTNTSSGAPGSPAAFVNSPATLLGSCPRAAFAVNLYTWARATDGYSRQYQYDDSATIAFALTHA